jgi:Fe-S-cluster containining protein
MSENIKLIIKLICAIIGILTAILGLKAARIGLKKAYIGLKKAYIGLKKAYIEYRNNKSEKGKNKLGDETNTHMDTGNIGTSIRVTADTINGDISIASSNDVYQEKANEGILLKDTYTSVFAEKGKISNETISIKNLGNGKIEGKVCLEKHNTYILNGTFKNGVLTGEFSSAGRYTDERGTINLKLISENILSGFCSFSKISNLPEDQIRMSPYVWVAGEDVNLLNGTYEFCTECHTAQKKCCCSSPEVDMPVLLQNEAQKIQSSNPKHRKMREFSHNIKNTSVRQINENSKMDGEKYCHFYNTAERECKIYDIRPTDCRLFPFDIKLDVETNEYWVGYYSDVCERKLPDIEKMKIYAHILRPQLFLLFPYANTINDKSVCERLSKASFEKLYRLEEFIF